MGAGGVAVLPPPGLAPLESVVGTPPRPGPPKLLPEPEEVSSVVKLV
jgi:hypothetical protein